MNARIATDRWADAAFQQAVLPDLRRLFHEKVHHGPLDLRGIRVCVEGPFRFLWAVDLVKASVSNVRFDNAVFACAFNSCDMSNVVFDESEFDNALMTASRFRSCGFRGCKVVSNMNDAVFQGCDFTKAKLLSPRALAEYGGRRVAFEECKFDGAVFRGVVFRASTFVNCTFTGARFTRCDIRGARFLPTPPEPGQFEKCDQ